MCKDTGDQQCPSSILQNINTGQLLIFHTTSTDSSRVLVSSSRLTRQTTYSFRLNIYYIFPHNYVRLNPDIQVLCSPTALCNGEDVVYRGPLKGALNSLYRNLQLLTFCYEVKAQKTLLNYKPDHVYDTRIYMYTHISMYLHMCIYVSTYIHTHTNVLVCRQISNTYARIESTQLQLQQIKQPMKQQPAQIT